MNIGITYLIIVAILLVAELLYFKIADKCNIIDKPNQRSSHTRIVLRGGGIIFTIAMIVWSLTPISSPASDESTIGLLEYWPFLCGLILIAGVSFIDDIHSLPDRVRLMAQFVAMGLMFWNLGLFSVERFEGSVAWMVLTIVAASIVFVGATNVINFMDGINGITAGYAFAVILPLIIKNEELKVQHGDGFVDGSFLIVTLLSILVFSWFNFRPKNKAKCFAGDVGSVGMAFILLFLIGSLVVKTSDVTWLILLVVYGVDGCCTIIHRIMLHENLGEAHRKHAYQLMANELGMSHVVVSLIYMTLQLVISLVLVYLVPDTVAWHWGYFAAVCVLLVLAYGMFMKKYYHLHEEYLSSIHSA